MHTYTNMHVPYNMRAIPYTCALTCLQQTAMQCNIYSVMMGLFAGVLETHMKHLRHT